MGAVEGHSSVGFTSVGLRQENLPGGYGPKSAWNNYIGFSVKICVST